jgi:hypothetical protein
MSTAETKNSHLQLQLALLSLLSNMAADYIVDLPLQVKDDGIFWNNSSSGSSEESNHLVESEEEICIWRRHQQYGFWNEDQNPSSPWDDRTRHLLVCTHTKQEEGGRTTYKINEAKLLEIIRSHKGSNASCAKHVAMISNDHRPTLALPFASPATLLQQLVFPPITGLLYAFDPELYAAGGSAVYTGIYTYKDRDGHRAPWTGTAVDAALTFSDQGHLVLAMLELDKAAGRAHDHHDDSRIMQKCVLLTSIYLGSCVGARGGIRSVTQSPLSSTSASSPASTRPRWSSSSPAARVRPSRSCSTPT